MNYIKNNRILFFSIFAFIIGLLFIIISVLLNYGKIFNNNAEVNTVVQEEGELHKSYSPDSDNDPFKNAPNPDDNYNVSQVEQKEEATIKVDKFSFYVPKNIEHYMQENVGSLLIDTHPNYLLFKSYGDILYVFDKKKNEKIIAHSDTIDAKFSPDGKYAVILSKELLHTQKIFSYDLSSGRLDELTTLGYEDKVTSFTVRNGLVYYSFLEDVTKQVTTKTVAITEYITKLKPSDLNFSFSDSGNLLDSNKNGVFTYLPNEKVLHKLDSTNSTAHDISVKTTSKMKEILQLDLNDNNDYLVVYYDENLNVKVNTNFGDVSDFKNLVKARWYGGKHLLILDTNTLYLYNIEEKKKAVLKTDISDFYMVNGDIIFHDSTLNLYLLKRK